MSKADNLTGNLTNILLFAAIAGCLVIDSWLSNLATLLVLMGFYVWFRQKTPVNNIVDGHDIQFDRDARLLLFAFCFFALVALLSWLVSGANYEGWKKLGRYLRFVLLFPLLALFLRVKLRESVFWLAAGSAAILAAVVAIYETGFVADYSNLTRAHGPTNPIIFGGLALLLGFIALVGSGHFYHKAGQRWLSAVCLLGFVAGISACLLSQTRGSLLVLPALVIIGSILLGRYRIHAWAATILITVVFVLVSESAIESRFKEAFQNIQVYAEAEADNNVGIRFDLWREALAAFAENPFMGVGVGHFGEVVQESVAEGELPARAAGLEHAHNDLMNALATRGLLGGLSLILLFAVPVVFFWRNLKSDSDTVRRLAVAGLLIVTGYIFFSQTEAVFNRGLLISFYIVMLAWVYVLLRRANQAAMTGKRMYNLSAVIITKNEERLIEACLQSVLPVADEIIVLDSGSTDRTVEIVRKYTDKVEVTDWPGYGPQKQRALEKASGDWILSIDADEQLTPFLAREINHTLSRQRDVAGYKLPWAVTIYGKQLDFGRSGRAPLRLFRRAGASFSPDVVHESIRLPKGSKTATLQGRLLHFTHRDYGHALEKSAAYAWLGAQRKYEAGKSAGLLHATLWSILTFIHIYIFRLGILDGRIGYLAAVQYAQTNFNKYAGLWTLNRVEALQRRERRKD